MSSPPKFSDRVQESSTTTGTGPYTLAGALTGYQSFAAVGDGNSAYYGAHDVDAGGNPAGGWEVGRGTYTLAGTTFSRDTILASSNANAAVNWAAGTRRIFVTVPAAYTPPLELAGSVIFPGSKFVAYQASLNIGDTDIYTVPTGRMALIGGWHAYNNSAGTIAYFPEVKVSGTYYRQGANGSLTTGSYQNTSTTPILLQAGDTFAMNVATTSGLIVTPSILEFDASAPLKLARLLGWATGDNTIYTCPAGKVATLGCLIVASNTFIAQGYVAGGPNATATFNLVPSGGTPGLTNRISANVNTGTSTRQPLAQFITGSLVAGDFLYMNISAGDPAQTVCVFVYEVGA